MRSKKKSVGFVPTMGFLHEGHLSLVRRSKAENDITVVSIFVNPTQFAPHEDLDRYPRDLTRDLRLLKKEKVDIIFYPSAKKIYPDGYLTFVHVRGITAGLCGRSRPGHFDGVTTIVLKLVHIVQPAKLYLGQKDAQQAIVIKRMVQDLNIPLKVSVLPIIRETDGLAMSSRNAYLSTRERQEARVLYATLLAAKKRIQAGRYSSKRIIQEMTSAIKKIKNSRIDYIACVNAETLEPVAVFKGKVMIALAVWIGKTRLIDNIVVHKK